MYRIYRKIHHADEGDFKLSVKSGEFPEDEGGIICMLRNSLVWIYTASPDLSVRKLRSITVLTGFFSPISFQLQCFVCWYFNKSSSQRQGNKLEFYVCVLQKHKEQSVHFSPEPLYNTVHYDMVLQNR